MHTKRGIRIIGLFIVFGFVVLIFVHLQNSAELSPQKFPKLGTGFTGEQTPSVSIVPPMTEKVPTPDDDPWVQHNEDASKFDTHVRFWGKVVDQNSDPVEGVDIAASVTTLRMIKTNNGYREYEMLRTKSTTDGSFMFDGAEGLYLDIEALGKVGYVLPAAYQAGTRWSGAKYNYRYLSIGNQEKVFTPNRSQPEVFHLWKLKKPEPLYIGGDTSGLNGPELKVGSPPERFRGISMVVTDVGSPQAPQWEVTVAALEADGGVVKADASDIFMFEAPAVGYTHSIKFRYGPDGTDQGLGDPGAPVRFFTRSHKGRWYTASEYAFFSPDQDGSVRTKMRYWLNPNGSRNLEHDAAHPLPEPRLTE